MRAQRDDQAGAGRLHKLPGTKGDLEGEEWTHRSSFVHRCDSEFADAEPGEPRPGKDQGRVSPASAGELLTVVELPLGRELGIEEPGPLGCEYTV